MSTTVLVLVGSLRASSTNLALAQSLAGFAPDGVEVVLHSGLELLPFYNDDLESLDTVDEHVARLRQAVLDADALLLVTPEYNGSLPAVLANAIDWISRPYNAGAVRGVPSTAIGTSLGRFGGVWAQEIARRALGIAGAAVIDETFLALPGSTKRYAELHPRDDAEAATGAAAALNALALAHADAVVHA